MWPGGPAPHITYFVKPVCLPQVTPMISQSSHNRSSEDDKTQGWFTDGLAQEYSIRVKNRLLKQHKPTQGWSWKAAERGDSHHQGWTLKQYKCSRTCVGGVSGGRFNCGRCCWYSNHILPPSPFSSCWRGFQRAAPVFISFSGQLNPCCLPMKQVRSVGELIPPGSGRERSKVGSDSEGRSISYLRVERIPRTSWRSTQNHCWSILLPFKIIYRQSHYYQNPRQSGALSSAATAPRTIQWPSAVTDLRDRSQGTYNPVPSPSE